MDIERGETIYTLVQDFINGWSVEPLDKELVEQRFHLFGGRDLYYDKIAAEIECDRRNKR